MKDDREKRFDQLFERYERPIWSFFAKRGLSGEDCHDLTQETFLGVYRGMERFRQDASVDTWVFTIAANVWRNKLRSGSAHKRDGEELPFERIREKSPKMLQRPELQAASDPLGELLLREHLDLLHEAIEELPPQMRQCFLQRIDKELKYDEIAKLMRISINTVKSQISQARERLKKRLDEIQASRGELEAKEAS